MAIVAFVFFINAKMGAVKGVAHITFLQHSPKSYLLRTAPLLQCQCFNFPLILQEHCKINVFLEVMEG